VNDVRKKHNSQKNVAWRSKPSLHYIHRRDCFVPVSSATTSIHQDLATHWNHREYKPELTEHSTRIGQDVRARRVLWWSQSDDIQDAFAAEFPSVVPGRIVAWTV